MTVAVEVKMYMAMLMMLSKPQCSTAEDNHLPSRDLPVDITVSPPAPRLMFVGTQLIISVLVTSAVNSTCETHIPACDSSVVMMMSVRSHRPTPSVALTTRRSLPTDSANDTVNDVPFRLNQSAVVAVNAVSVGRATLLFEIFTTSTKLDTVDNKRVAINVDSEVDDRYKSVQVVLDGGQRLVPLSRRSHLLAVIEYHVTVARHRRPVDDGFFWAVATATLLNAFGLGCVTVYSDVIQELRKLQPSVLASLLCQFVILPPVCSILQLNPTDVHHRMTASFVDNAKTFRSVARTMLHSAVAKCPPVCPSVRHASVLNISSRFFQQPNKSVDFIWYTTFIYSKSKRRNNFRYSK